MATKTQPTLFWLISLLILIFDQGIKIAVKLNLAPGQEFWLLGNWFKLVMAENEGIAFGVTFQEVVNSTGLSWGAFAGRTLLLLLSVICLVALIWLMNRARKGPFKMQLFLALLLGGALGNFVDRVFYGWWFADINAYPGGLLEGRVVDMFLFDPFGSYLPMPVFNLADLSILAGVLGLLFSPGLLTLLRK